jgi:hypothetical protein
MASDSAALALGIGILRRASQLEGSEEIRIWTGAALAVPEVLLRLTRRGDKVAGSMAWHWRLEEPDTAVNGKQTVTIDAVMRYSNAGRCRTIRRFGDAEACMIRLTGPPDWRAMWDSLDVLSVWTLPDQSELPRDGKMPLDGWSMTVEVRDGPRYRSYAYSNPDAHQHPAQVAAAAIGQMNLLLAKLIPRPSNEHLYRGRLEVGPGVSEFAACGSDTVWEVYGSLGARLDSAGMLRAGQDTTGRRAFYAELRGMLAFPGLAKEWGRPYGEILEVDSVLLVEEWTSPRHCR